MSATSTPGWEEAAVPVGANVPAAAGQDVTGAARDARQQCVCGGGCEDGGCDPVTGETVARMRAYLAAHPGQQFAYDEGIVAVIVPGDPGPPDIIAAATGLPALLDQIGAPPAAVLS